MKTSVFFDTNVLVYMFDPREDFKRKRARSFFRFSLMKWHTFISIQVLGELFVILRSKIEPKPPISKIEKILQFLQDNSQVVGLERNDMWKAINIVKRYNFKYWDSLLLAVALRCGCRYFFSEDLSHGQKIEEMRIVNPLRV